MLQVVEFRARSFDLDTMDLWWRLSDFFDDDILAYDFYVLRSESIAGPYEIIAGPFQDQYYFRDVSPALVHKWRQLFYKLRIIKRSDLSVLEFGPTSHEAEPDLIALEIQRQEDTLFRELAGRIVYIFPVRTFGAKCTCYDRVSGRRTRSNCLTCYDEGYLGGFLSPISVPMQIDPSAKRPQLAAVASSEQQSIVTSARLSSYPPVKPRDIIIEAENKRWRVVTVTGTQRLRARVRQELTMQELPREDIVFKLPINVADLTKLQPSAERNFTNPQHIDQDDASELLAVYGYKPRGSAR